MKNERDTHESAFYLSNPTYGELIDLLDESETADELYLKFKQIYPIGHRFYNTVSQIAAPTKPGFDREMWFN